MKKIKLKYNKSYYALLIGMFSLAVISIYSNFSTLWDRNQAVDVDNDATPVINTNQASQEEKSNNLDTRKPETVVNTNAQVTVKPLSFISPLSGKKIKDYSEKELLYSVTLETWKTHDGIDIAALPGSYVYASEKGKVERVYEDSFYGTTVIVSHTNGYQTIYSNLNTNVIVKEGGNILKGYKIGMVGNTSIGELKDQSHLHFSLMKDGKIIDPKTKISL